MISICTVRVLLLIKLASIHTRPGNQGRGKTSTSIILDEKINTYLKFGTDAKNAVPDYTLRQKGRYFEYFKMQLYKHKPNTAFVVKDAAGEDIDALIVFKESLRFIKNGMYLFVFHKFQGLACTYIYLC